MPDKTPNVTPPGETPEVTPSASETPAAGKTAAELQAELDRTARALKEANKEAATRRKRLDELEAAETERANASKTELEKAQARTAELENQLKASQMQAQERAIRAEIRVQAASMGFVDPDDAYRADVLAAITVGEDGEVGGVKDALKQLAKDKPYLLGSRKPAAPSADAGAGNMPERGGEVLTPGELAAVQSAQAMGYHIDTKKVAERKAASRLVTMRRDNEE
jgi:hypothetical protein